MPRGGGRGSRGASRGRGSTRGRGRGGRQSHFSGPPAPRPSARHISLNKSIGQQTTAASLLAFVETEALSSLNLVNCTTSLQRLAKLAVGNSDTAPLEELEPLVARAAECFAAERAQPRQVAGCLWALAKLKAAKIAAMLVPAVLRAGLALEPAWFKSQEASMAVWSLGKLCASRFGVEVRV